MIIKLLKGTTNSGIIKTAKKSVINSLHRKGEETAKINTKAGGAAIAPAAEHDDDYADNFML